MKKKKCRKMAERIYFIYPTERVLFNSYNCALLCLSKVCLKYLCLYFSFCNKINRQITALFQGSETDENVKIITSTPTYEKGNV